MSFVSWAKRILVVSGVCIASLGATYFYLITPHHSSAPPDSAEALTDRADTLAWGNRWEDAKPLYSRAEQLFVGSKLRSRALYAKVSQMPPDETGSISDKLLALNGELESPEAKDDPETKLRILTIRGMLETNYDATLALATWHEVKTEALRLRHLELASRAEGEEGIAAFILGDTDTAKKKVVRAWSLSKVEHDPAATVRYASVFGAGLVQFHRYKEAMTPLDQAIETAKENPTVAYPTIAVYAEIEALAGLHHYDSALALANTSLARLAGTPYEQHKVQVYISRGSIYKQEGDWGQTILNYQKSVAIAIQTNNWRAITDSAGLLAQAYEHNSQLPEALRAVDSAIQANTHVPDELYLEPRNLAIKARITAEMGHPEAADLLYEKSVTLVDGMINHAATINIQRYLLSEMSDVYSGYFATLCDQKHYDRALQTIEKAHGRIETEALEHHASQSVHPPTAGEKELTRLNLALINSDDASTRASLTNAIYNTELQISPSALTQETISRPVHLSNLQKSLGPDSLLIEYSLAEPNSYAFAITREGVTAYRLPAKNVIETDAEKYRKEIHAQKEDPELAHRLFQEVLEPIRQYGDKQDLVVIPDGSLHLLPFSALADGSGYVVKSHTIDVAPSSTVYELLLRREHDRENAAMPYIGVAAWTQPSDDRNAVIRAVAGPQRSQLVPLPDSKMEVEAIAGDLPHPSTILLGSDATESNFKHAFLASTDVVHLALHGYADLDYPDRSALIFAPEASSSSEDGLLQVREIRGLHLRAKLVTLSACNTGVGPVGESGVANLVNAFIEAGADSVVSTLWELEDHTTKHLMTNFYGQLALHKRKVDALREAQLDLLNQGLAPYYWASFQVVGDPNGAI